MMVACCFLHWALLDFFRSSLSPLSLSSGGYDRSKNRKMRLVVGSSLIFFSMLSGLSGKSLDGFVSLHVSRRFFSFGSAKFGESETRLSLTIPTC